MMASASIRAIEDKRVPIAARTGDLSFHRFIGCRASQVVSNGARRLRRLIIVNAMREGAIL